MDSTACSLLCQRCLGSFISLKVPESSAAEMKNPSGSAGIPWLGQMAGNNNSLLGQWWWLSWLSGCFRHQRSPVRIPSSANFIYQLYIDIEKTKIKKKRSGMAHLKKKICIRKNFLQRIFFLKTDSYQILQILSDCLDDGSSSLMVLILRHLLQDIDDSLAFHQHSSRTDDHFSAHSVSKTANMIRLGHLGWVCPKENRSFCSIKTLYVLLQTTHSWVANAGPKLSPMMQPYLSLTWCSPDLLYDVTVLFWDSMK